MCKAFILKNRGSLTPLYISLEKSQNATCSLSLKPGKKLMFSGDSQEPAKTLYSLWLGSLPASVMKQEIPGRRKGHFVELFSSFFQRRLASWALRTEPRAWVLWLSSQDVHPGEMLSLARRGWLGEWCTSATYLWGRNGLESCMFLMAEEKEGGKADGASGSGWKLEVWERHSC